MYLTTITDKACITTIMFVRLTQHEYDGHSGRSEAAAPRVAVHVRGRIGGGRGLLAVGHGPVAAAAVALHELVAVAPHEGRLEVPLVLVLEGHLCNQLLCHLAE